MYCLCPFCWRTRDVFVTPQTCSTRACSTFAWSWACWCAWRCWPTRSSGSSYASEQAACRPPLLFCPLYGVGTAVGSATVGTRVRFPLHDFPATSFWHVYSADVSGVVGTVFLFSFQVRQMVFGNQRSFDVRCGCLLSVHHHITAAAADTATIQYTIQ